MTRVVSLLPGATEIIAALGPGADLVGVSHECDHPPWVSSLPRVTSTPIDTGRPGAAIDADVRRLVETGTPVIVVDAEAIRRLEPDVVITQALCEVCAVADGEVHRVAAVLDRAPEILTLAGHTISGITQDIERLGERLGLADEAAELVLGMRYRLRRLGGGRPAPGARVVCIEWLEPLYLAGHWVPELVEAAGGVDVGARPGEQSRRGEWDEIRGLQPEVVIVMLCGFGVERSLEELRAFEGDHAGPGHPLDLECPIWVLDGGAYTSRPGPRIVDGAERIHAAIKGKVMPGLERYAPS